MESARSDQPVNGRELTEEQKLARREQQSLLLSRSYVQQQLESSPNERYAQSLRQALAEIERKLASLEHQLRGLS
jgi:hypothetical protein